MTTQIPRSSVLARFTLNSLELAVRLWPENSRHWGKALLAEIGEITEPGATFSWAVGGIFLSFRVLLAHLFDWMKLPAGARLSNASQPVGGNAPLFPKRSRMVTAVILLATAFLFFLPAGREARTTVSASWREMGDSPSDRRELEKLAAQAESEHDARGLAFVALSYPDPQRASQLAERAVALDPKLVWIYASSFGRPEAAVMKQDWLDRLKSSDPDNAFVYLVGAQTEGEPRIERTIVAHSAREEALRNVLTGDDQWLKEMDQAFRAPRYDSYSKQRGELIREGWQKRPSLSPALAGYGLWSHSLPDGFQITTYADLRIRQALQAGTVGKVDQAQEILAEVTAFGKRMGEESETQSEQYEGLTFTRQGLEGFHKLYARAGSRSEAEKVQAQLHEVEMRKEKLMHASAFRAEGLGRYRRKAVLVQVLATLALFLAAMTSLSLFVLEVGAAFSWLRIRMGRRLACYVAGYGPALLLVVSVIFLFSFQTFASVLEQYRSANQTNIEAVDFVWQLSVLQRMNPLSYLDKPDSRYIEWLVLTIVLAITALAVLVRGLLKHKTVHATTP